MNDSDSYTARKSAEAVSMIDGLAKQPEFLFFLDRMRDRENRYADAVLNNDMGEREREHLRQRRLEIVEVIEWIEKERQAHVSILAQYGIQPGDGLEIGL